MKLNLSADVMALNADVLRGKKDVSIDTELGGYRSKLEKRAAETWAPRNLEWFLYEPFSLKFPGGSYTPDLFGPMINLMQDSNYQGRLVAIEIKGFNKNLRADRLKFRVAAEHHRWLRLCWLTWKDGDWNEEWYEPRP